MIFLIHDTYTNFGNSKKAFICALKYRWLQIIPVNEKRYISNSITMNEVHITACQHKCKVETSKHSNCWAALETEWRRWLLNSCSFHCNSQSPVNYVPGNLDCLLMSHSGGTLCVSVPIRTSRAWTLNSGKLSTTLQVAFCQSCTTQLSSHHQLGGLRWTNLWGLKFSQQGTTKPSVFWYTSRILALEVQSFRIRILTHSSGKTKH